MVGWKGSGCVDREVGDGEEDDGDGDGYIIDGGGGETDLSRCGVWMTMWPS